jgi:hypothetical protein
MTTDQKGAIAELAVQLAATRLGIDVYRPVAEGGRYDIIFDLVDRLLRVQCKWATRREEVLVVSCQSARRCADGFIRRPYTTAEVDAIAAYSLELNRCFLIPIERVDGKPSIVLRLSPCRNNQKRRINWADDFDLAATLRRQHGAVAQLGERLAGSQ